MAFASNAASGIMKPTNMPLSVVLINFNGLRLLQGYFASVVESVRREEAIAEFIVVDNASADGSPQWLARNHPAVRVLREERNRIFCPGGEPRHRSGRPQPGCC